MLAYFDRAIKLSTVEEGDGAEKTSDLSLALMARDWKVTLQLLKEAGLLTGGFQAVQVAEQVGLLLDQVVAQKDLIEDLKAKLSASENLVAKFRAAIERLNREFGKRLAVSGE